MYVYRLIVNDLGVSNEWFYYYHFFIFFVIIINITPYCILFYYNVQHYFKHSPNTTVNGIGTLLFCSSSVFHIWYIGCLYIHV